MAAHSGDRLAAALLRTVEALRRRRVRYALIGAWALGVWGRPRATFDVDFLVLVEGAALDALAAQLGHAGLRIDTEWREWNPLLAGTQVRLAVDSIAVDLLAPRDRHDRRVLERRRRKRMAGQFCWVVAPDDLILQKLKIGRPRDFEDAVTVVARVSAELDRAYLRRWARRLGVTAELAYVERLGSAGA